MSHMKSMFFSLASASFVLLVFCASRLTVLTAQEPGGPQEPPGEEPKPADEKPKELTKEEAKAKLDAFKKAYNAAVKDERARADAVDALEGALHPDIMAILGAVLVSDKADKVREAAAYALGSMKDKRAIPFLDKGVQTNKRKYTIWVAIFDALGEIADPGCVVPLTKFIKANASVFEKNIRNSVEAAINALGEVKHVTAIDGLIKCFELIGLKEGLTEDEQKSIYDSYASTYCRALGKLTGQGFYTQPEWHKWWQKNAKTFKFEEEPKEEKKAE